MRRRISTLLFVFVLLLNNVNTVQTTSVSILSWYLNRKNVVFRYYLYNTD